MTTQWFGETVERRRTSACWRAPADSSTTPGTALGVAFVRSSHAHARITGVDVADALDVDGLVAIYTWDDLPGRLADPLPLLIPHPDLTHPRTQYALARGEVNHVGEPVAMVVAADRYIAEDAANASWSTTSRCRRSSASVPPGRPSTWSTPTFPGTWRR